VIRTDQDRLPGAGLELAIMAEDVRRAAADGPARLQHVEVRVERDLPEGDNHPHFDQQVEFAFEKRAAIAEFFGSRLVARRRTSRGRGDEDVAKYEAVFARNAGGLRGKSGPVKRAIENLA
jgi:hypothetical protein